MDQIRWRVTYQDTGLSNFVAGIRQGGDPSGEGTPGGIVGALEENLGDGIGAEAIEAWLGGLEPASAGVLATLADQQPRPPGSHQRPQRLNAKGRHTGALLHPGTGVTPACRSSLRL
jgi:hypothetical protein